MHATRRNQKSALRAENLIEVEGLAPRLRTRFRQLLEAANGALEGSRRGASKPPQDKPWSLFKTAIYRCIHQLEAEGQLGQIRSIVRSSPYAPVSIRFEDNPFHWAMFLLSKSREFDEYRKLTAEKIYEYGVQLAYAHRHRIPPDLLIGFLYQAQVTKSAKRRFIESNIDFFEPWRDDYLAWLDSVRKPSFQVLS